MMIDANWNIASIYFYHDFWRKETLLVCDFSSKSLHRDFKWQIGRIKNKISEQNYENTLQQKVLSKL